MQKIWKSGSRDVWTSGMWAGQDWMDDYRAQWLGEMLVERATFSELTMALAYPATGSPPRPEGSRKGSRAQRAPAVWAAPGHIWVRFWLLADDRVIDKAFGIQGDVLGYFMPVTQPLERIDDKVMAQTLYLGMWMDTEQRITVTGEDQFDSAVARGELTPVEIEHAEFRIRNMTTAAAAHLLPSAFVRNFTILKEVSP